MVCYPIATNHSVRNYGGIPIAHEYVLIYQKDVKSDELNLLTNENKNFTFCDENGNFNLMELRNRNSKVNSKNRPNLYYPFYVHLNNQDENDLYEVSLTQHNGFVIYSNKALFNDLDIHKHNDISRTTRYLTLDYRLFAIMYKFNMYAPLRIHNVISLEWSSIDFKNKMLVIPAYKMKLNKEFKLPLSSQALEILEFMYKQKLDKYVFSCALSDKIRMQRSLYNALNEYLELEKQGLIARDTQRKLANKYLVSYSSIRDLIHRYKKDNSIKDKYKKFIDNALHKHTKYKAYTNFLTTHKLNTPHRIRSTFSTILYDLTPKHKLDFSIIEMCLAHSVGNMVIQSYNHSERMQERLELMQFWADYIDKLAHENTLQQVVNNSDLYVLNPTNDNDTLRF